MKKFKDKEEPTWAEWLDIISTHKDFVPGDVVEYAHKIWIVLCLSKHYKGYKYDNVYELEEYFTKKLATASSSFMHPISTFIDDTLF